MATSTSFRLSDRAKRRLAERAARDGLSATALLERLIIEGIDQLDHPGVVFRGPAHDRRAGLAGGPDVWEMVARLQELEGPEEDRVAVTSEETDLHPRLIRIALDYAADNPEDVRHRIDLNRKAAMASKRAAKERAALIA